MNEDGRRQIVFVDLEASGLLPGSYPTEVGWAKPRALPDGRCTIELGSVLVRPEPDWLSAGSWDPDAETVHGLSRQYLRSAGLPAEDVCDLLDREFRDHLVITDTGAGSVDDMWLAVLYEAAGRDPAGWAVESLTATEVLRATCCAHGLKPEIVARPLLLQAPTPTHAAAEDALGQAWLYAMLEQLGRFRVGDRDEAGQRAALRDLGRTLPRDCWPRTDPRSRFRRRT